MADSIIDNSDLSIVTASSPKKAPFKPSVDGKKEKAKYKVMYEVQKVIKVPVPSHK